jgi:glyoxylase-like metal-dependent hydrolase (beta-lactamase superfamily II)
MMDTKYSEIQSGIALFKGRLSRNLMVEPITSNTYFLEDGDEVVIFDPSAGKDIAQRIENHIRSRLKADARWQRAFLIAGHSHLDHANNFYLSDIIGAPDTHIYVHESGFHLGKVMNQPGPFIEHVAEESSKYYNPYLAFPFPYNIAMIFLAVMDRLSPYLARKVFSMVGSIPWPNPADGSLDPEPLREDDIRPLVVGGFEVRGWRAGNKVILPTPGHSPCSISLFWPEKKALCISDVDWIGNPVFMSASVRDSISSLEMIRSLTEAGKVELLLPAHGRKKEGPEQILSHLDFHIRCLEEMRNEVMATYRSCGEVKDVRKLTRVLTRESPLFRMLKLTNYPRMVVFVHNIVAMCLKEEGILN